MEENKCVLAKNLDYITDETNVWNPEKYVSGTRSGKVLNGTECQFNIKYCLGNAYLQGYIGKMFFKLFYQQTVGFQVYVASSTEELNKIEIPMLSVPQYRKELVLQMLLERSSVY